MGLRDMNKGVWWKSVITLIMAVIMFGCGVAMVLAEEPDNTIIINCQEKYNWKGMYQTNTKSWMNIAACISSAKNEVRRTKQSEQWEFVKANPRYRFPGQSLNKCFGRPKESVVHRVETTNNKTVFYYKNSIKPCVR